MIIHSYFTEGYYPWALLFVESLKKSNGEKHQVILSSRNLPEGKQNHLKSLYKNLEVRNKNLDYKEMAKKAGISLSTLMGFKSETEHIKISKHNWVWKLMISAEDRIREIRDVVSEQLDDELVLNLDIDSYIRKKLDPWIEVIAENDFSSIIKYDKQIRKFGYIKKKAYVIICCIQGYKVSNLSREFLDRWVFYIDRVSPKYRPRGFGQITCYEAYMELKEKLWWGIIPPDTYSLTGNGDCILWGANKGPKDANLMRFRKDFGR